MIRFAPHFGIDVITRTGRGNYITNGNMVVVFDETIFERNRNSFFMFSFKCSFIFTFSEIMRLSIEMFKYP